MRSSTRTSTPGPTRFSAVTSLATEAMRDKLVSLAEAAALIPSGATLGLGGLMLRRHPMALIRELIRQGVHDLTLQTWVGGIDVDLLVGAGCVKRIEAAYEGVGPLGTAPNVRRRGR